MGLFDIKPGPSSAIAEIQRRVGEGGIKFAGKRYPWIRISTKGYVLDSKKYPEYEASSKRPGPIATGVDVKKQGELGTTRRATVKFTCFTDNQLAQITPSFFNPGDSMAVEWGWSVGGGGGSAGAPSNANLGNDVLASQAMRNASAGNPNYDGLQGRIANFNYSLTADNTWECQVEIIAAAETIMGGSAGNYDCAEKCAIEKDRQDGDKKDKTTIGKSTLGLLLKSIFDDFDKNAAAYASLGTITKGNYMGPQRTETGQDDSSWYEGGFIGAIIRNKPDATEAYISYGALEEAINRYCIPDGKNPNTAVGRIDTRKGGMLLKTFPGLESSDPRVCILPGSPYASQIVKDFVADSCFEGDGINLSKILLNNVFLMTQLDQVEQQENPRILDFLKGVLNKVSDVCGGIWGFEVVSADSESGVVCPTVSIVDIKAGPKAGAAPAVIPTNSNDSVVREFKLALKLTDSMKTQAVYSKIGAPAAKSPSGGNCDTKAIAAIGMMQSKPPKPPPPTCDCGNAGDNKPKTFAEAFADLAKEVTDDTVNTARTLMLGKILSADDSNLCKSMPLPFEFSLTLDGIGGFGFGQAITSTRLPSSITANWIFQVTAVEHSVTAQDWTTTINTIARLKN